MLTYQDWAKSVLSELEQRVLGILDLDSAGGRVQFYLHPMIGYQQKLIVVVSSLSGSRLSASLDGILGLENLAMLKAIERTEYLIPYTVLNVDGAMVFAHEVFEKFLSKHSGTLIDYYQTQIEGGASEQEQDYAVLMVQTVRTYKELTKERE